MYVFRSGRHRRALGELEHLAAENAALRKVATAVAEEASADTVLALVAEELARLVGVEAGRVVRYEENDKVRTVGAWGLIRAGSTEVGDLLSIAPGGAIDQLRATGRTARFDERGQVPTLPPIVQRVAAPVRVNGRVWGAVIATTSSFEDLPANVEQRLSRFAELAALAIANTDAREHLTARATTDPLTGLLNHRAFHERLGEEVARARREDRPLAVALFDVDHFKQINDAFGHGHGDAVLAEAARRLATAIRAGEPAGRIGGDELAVVLGAQCGDERTAAERIRSAIGAIPYPDVGQLTFSAGVCPLTLADDADDLLRLADGALYWAKAQGRDVCVLYSPDVVEELSVGERAERLARSQALSGLRALARAIDAKDPSTIRHSERVAALAGALAETLGWKPTHVNRLREAGLVHDVGKIGVPDAVLTKPGRLTADEYEQVKAHAALGAEIVRDLLSEEETLWVRGHHERHDGLGYPDGLAGEAIADGARILAVADAWDAMTKSRPYGTPLPLAEAHAECLAQAGAQFDPTVVMALDALWAAGTLGAVPAARPRVAV